MKKRIIFKAIALTLIFTLVGEIGMPIICYALTSGPSQPEVQSFTPASLSNMVDPFTGDFSYNIPLMDIEGYPINISYQSGVTMDQEASWVGLGWNINPGVVSRNVRGLPDDFNGETVEKTYSTKPNTTVGASGGFGAELFGLDYLKFNAGLGISYNNYTGIGFEQTMNVSISAGCKAFGKNTPSLSLGFTSSNNGLTINPSFSIDQKANDKHIFDVSASYNSRAGLQSFGFHYTPTSLNIGGVAQASIGANFTYGAYSYTPKIEMSTVTSSISASFKAGLTLFGLEGTGNLAGYVTTQRLLRKVENIPAYGYMYSENSNKNPNVLLDFNREKDQNFSENTPALPLANFTCDLFTVTGQGGVGGTFRPYRSDIGYVYDNYAVNQSNSFSLGVELSGSNIVKVGGDVGINLVSGSSGAWKEKNDAANTLQFTDKHNNDPLFEPFYFKRLGELTAETESSRFNDLGGNKATRIQLAEGGGLDIKANSALTDENDQTYNIPNNTIRSNRARRDDVITYLTQSQAQKFGLSNIIPNSNAKDYHIAAISSLRPDGSKYVYGIAAYNTLKEETTFSVGVPMGGGTAPNVDCKEGTVAYSEKQNSRFNESGIDNYYNKVVTPAYAHSYLLTAVLSADYVDIDNIRGPSDGDLGQYKKFNYKKTSDKYSWRLPIDKNRANYNQGLKSDLTDDKADIVYGEKELWYLESVESKNYIAIFTTSAREDGYGVIDRNGGIDAAKSEKMMKLDKISLYSKKEYLFSLSGGPAAIPIKEVNFVYNYALCPNVKNNITTGNGKLTLQKIYFTYGGSYRSSYNGYNFTYSTFNPGYDSKACDRWGNYKPNTVLNATGCDASSPNALNSEAPYTVQDPALEKTYASAWALTNISTPTGGKITVDYESDDYTYVQDKRAAQMYNIIGMQSSAPSTPALGWPAYLPAGSQLITGSANNVYLVFKLTNPSASYSDAQFYKDYLDGINQLHFKFMVDITQSSKNFEYVSGYCDIDYGAANPYGVFKASNTATNYEYGYVKIKEVNIGDRSSSASVNPIAKAAWQFGRQALPQRVWDGVDQTSTGPEQLIQAIAGSNFAKNIVETFQGPNNTIRGKGYGNDVKVDKSWIRLNSQRVNPSNNVAIKAKLGGGSRVAQIQISDQWHDMNSSGSTSTYGQKFTYTKFDPKLGEIISSGVASNEPQAGGEENILHQPVWFGDKDQRLLAPDDKFYMEEPFGETFYPSPSVGYSEVKIESLYPSGVNVTKHSTGYTINKFYTARDFPVVATRTGLDAQPKESEPLLKIFLATHKNYMTASQGFSIELNDMHGKPKSEEIYAVGQKDPISKKEYIYNCEKLQNSSYRLVNNATVINPNGSNTQTDIGLDYDIVADMREQESSTYSTQIGLNLNTFLAFIPIPIPTSFPMLTYENVRFRSAVVTKIINRYGLLKEVIAQDMTSKIATKNLAYDAETGEVLLTQTNNAFDDPVYSFTYPAHWYYNGMGGAYKNINAKIPNIVINGSGILNYPNASSYFALGDQLILESTTGSSSGWVSAIIGNNVSIINDAGATFAPASYNATIIQSGRKNLQSNHIGSFVTGINPLPYIQNGNINSLLKAEAVEYSDDVKTFCECFTNGGLYIFKSQNPYITGRKGIWHVLKSYTFLTDRELTLANNSPHLRSDGYFAKFTPFWQYSAGQWNRNLTDWTWPSEVTIQIPYNVEVENRNALDQYQSAVFGYNQSLPTAISTNARYSDIGYDNFEDYDFPTCADDHFSFKNYKLNIDKTEAHTGKTSIKLLGTNPTSIYTLHKNLLP
jgi:hypothetical protein